ncbi:MAG: hypothetical protein ACK5IP_21565 [Paracoccus sp. (in: a-proteobacteria)]
MNSLQKQLCAALEARMKGRKVRVPEAGRELLAAFAALSRARSYGPSGPNPISYGEIAAWCSLMRMPLAPHHVEIIAALDEVWMAQVAKRQTPEVVKTLPQVSEHPISAALLDAVLG